jgi:putative nucleotidyltransferase with HDIG domain
MDAVPDVSLVVAGQLMSGMGNRWHHVQLVAKTVDELLAEHPTKERVLCAAWLHDIGYAPELVMTGMHALDGAAHLRRIGVPQAVVSLVAHHTGAEFEAEERELGADLASFPRPAQDELDLLILADLLSGPTGDRVTVDERLADIFERYAPEHPVHRAVSRSRKYLEDCCQRAAAAVGYPM